MIKANYEMDKHKQMSVEDQLVLAQEQNAQLIQGIENAIETLRNDLYVKRIENALHTLDSLLPDKLK